MTKLSQGARSFWILRVDNVWKCKHEKVYVCIQDTHFYVSTIQKALQFHKYLFIKCNWAIGNNWWLFVQSTQLKRIMTACVNGQLSLPGWYSSPMRFQHLKRDLLCSITAIPLCPFPSFHSHTPNPWAGAYFSLNAGFHQETLTSPEFRHRKEVGI